MRGGKRKLRQMKFSIRWSVVMPDTRAPFVDTSVFCKIFFKQNNNKTLFFNFLQKKKEENHCSYSIQVDTIRIRG